MLGYLYALLAAICNSTIGIISCFAFKGLSFYQVAFFKCFFAFLILSFLCVASKAIRKEVKALWQQKSQIAILSFFGIFILYYFETKAFSLAPVGIVAFLVYSAGILTIILGYFLLDEEITTRKILCVFLVISGAALIVNNFASTNLESIICALIGGIGYSLFLVFFRKFHLKANIGFLWWLVGFGSLYLSVPSFLSMDTLSWPESGIYYILALSVVPTLSGFYFTSKALNLTEASRVQVIEMSDPLFATLLAFVFLGDVIEPQEMLGGLLILVGLILVSG